VNSWAVRVAAVLLSALAAPIVPGAGHLLANARSAQDPLAGWRPAPEFLPLFTPPRAPAGAYAAYATGRALEAVLDEVRRNPEFTTPGAWQVHTLIPFDAFGESGRYDRWKVARLYGARRARVARAPRVEDGQVREVWTMVSPYPGATLDRLEQGTLLLLLRIR
jgi:hypothetical protein